MFNKIAQRFKGDRKIFSIVFFVIVLLGISGIVTDIIIEKTKKNWEGKLSSKITNIEESIKNDFQIKQQELLSKLNTTRIDLQKTLQPGNDSYKELIKLVNRKTFENYSVEVFAPNGKLIAWNQSISIKQNELFPLNFPLSETYFLSTYLQTFLSIVDTAHIQSDVFYLTVSTPIEKNYSLSNQYFNKISFRNELSSEYDTDIDIDYSPYNTGTRDGRKYSFEILNNKENKIALVTFFKPQLNTSVNQIKETASKIQSMLVLIALLFIGMGLKSDFKKIKSKQLKFILSFIYLVFIRAILFWIAIPAKLISGTLVDSSNFSSAFAWGIVKSPIEFFTTNIFLALIGIQFYRYTSQYLFNEKNTKYKFIGFLFVVPLMALMFLVIRGFSAAIRSVVFDSTIRYFKEPNILPDFVSLVMNFNILLLGFATVLVLIGLIFLIIKYLYPVTDIINKPKFIFSTILISAIIFLIYFISNNPLITPTFMGIFLVMLFISSYQTIFRSKHSIYNYVMILLIASVISITLLNYFNTKLEKESLKTTALELNRTDQNLLSFMLEETLRNVNIEQNVTEIFGSKRTNFDALAFILWSKSSMQRESLNSGIRFYDKNKNILGEYLIGINPDNKIFRYLNASSDETPIIELSGESKDHKYVGGLLRIKERGITKGYIGAFAAFDINSIGALKFPDFVESNFSILNSVIDVKQLKIFQFTNSQLTQVYGDIYPSREQIKQLLQTKIDSTFNDAWLKLKFEEENYETYIFQTQNADDVVLTTVSVVERAFTWKLFNFFKIFIVHTLFIVMAFILIFLARIRKVSISFKSKLLFAFLFISVIPVIILALYNRQMADERGRDSIFSELSQRANYVENHIETRLQKNKNRDLILVCQSVTKELGISFSLYAGTDQIYNSQDIYNRIGFFDQKLNSEAHYSLNYLRYREFLTLEKINNFNYDSYYRYIKLFDKDYILSVNDAFNKIIISFSTIEADVVIFGIYSFAVIIIIIVSTFFANQISLPIRRLTKATEAVGKGDLNIKIDHSERGELKDLLDGFNLMTSELKKNQIELAEMEREAAWKEMAKQVAHEIKNPLTPMKLALQQLVISYKDKSKDFDKLFEKVSHTVLNQIDNLNQIASEFSRFAKMPSLNLHVLDLVSSVQDVVNMFIHEKTLIEIETKLEKADIEADLSQLRRMLINLIRNSMQAQATKIKISIIKDQDKFIVLFQDNGHGIKDSEKERIFDEHFTTKKQGMGLGLSLAKRFMESIKGEIVLHSTSSNGSVFRITIPVYIKNSNS